MDNILEIWKEKQIELKSFLRIKNSEKWQYDLDKSITNLQDLKVPDDLLLIGGIDISFDKVNNELACVCIVVCDSRTNLLLGKLERIVKMTERYVVNFLAFRECEHMVVVVKEFVDLYPDLRPQVILVDGNGIYHKFGFGSASQLGVRLEQEGLSIPTVGVAKNYLQLERMPGRDDLHKKMAVRIVEQENQDVLLDLFGGDNDGPICTVRKLHHAKSQRGGIGRLAFISPGHAISLVTAVNVVRLCSKCRVPEPILLADHLGKQFLSRRQAVELL